MSEIDVEDVRSGKFALRLGDLVTLQPVKVLSVEKGGFSGRLPIEGALSKFAFRLDAIMSISRMIPWIVPDGVSHLALRVGDKVEVNTSGGICLFMAGEIEYSLGWDKVLAYRVIQPAPCSP